MVDITEQSTTMPPRVRALPALLLAAGAYYLLARLGLLLALEQSNASPIWPPSGFALFVLLRYGRHFWPAIIIGAFCANLAQFLTNEAGSLPMVLAASLAIAVGNTAEALIANWLLRWQRLESLALHTQREVYRFGVVIALASVAAAAAGVLSLLLFGIIPAKLAGQVAATWWVGDFLGMLVLAPLGMALPRRWSMPRPQASQVLFLAALLAATLAIFLSDSRAANVQLLPYALLLFIGLAAVQRWRGMVRIALAVIAVVAIPATVLDRGPFVSGVLHHSLLSLCTFLGISAMLAWVLATDEDAQAADEFAWTPILTLMACMAITAGAWGWISHDNEVRTRERFYRTADNLRETLRIRLDSYQSMLRAGAALFEASRQVDREEWGRFVAGLELPNQYPGVLGLGFARFIPDGSLAPALAEIHAQGEPHFRLWPEGRRESYVPIVFLEPRSTRNLRAIGYDMMSEPSRRIALAAAMQDGKMTATGPVTLVQEISGPRQVGFLMFNPIYTGTEGGRRALLGFVYSPFRMGDLMHGVFGASLRDLHLEVRFRDQMGEVMYSSPIQAGDKSYLRLTSVHRVAVGDNGQGWSLYITPTAQFDATVDQGKSFLVLLMGTLISLLFFGVARNLVHERLAAQRAQQVTDRQLQRQTAHLEESEARFRLLTSHIRNHAIVLLDAGGTITTWNDGAEKLFGYQGGDIVGRHVSVLQAEGAADASMARAMQYGEDEVTAPRRRQDGSTFLALVQIFPVRDEQGGCIGFAMILRDVTAEKAAEKELNDAKTQAESASAAKSAFVANISHELRTPMNAVLGLTQILGRTPLNAEQRQYLDMVSGAGKSLLALLNDVLDFSKIEANKLELSEVDFLLDQVLDAIAAVMATTAADKGLALSLTVAPDVPLSLHGDVQRLQQVLLNLVSNALKFTDSGTVTVRASRMPERPGYMRWEVSDTGIGITSVQMQRLFSPFSQADASMARRYGGTGLGLAISQRLAQMMGGEITVASSAGQGTTFSVQLPMHAAALPDPYTLPSAAQGWRVLYAEPNPRLQGDLEALSAHWHWQCETVASEGALHAALQAGTYELLVYDSSFASAGRAARQVPHRICLRSGWPDEAAPDGAACEHALQRPLTRSALHNALVRKDDAPADAATAFSDGHEVLGGVTILLAEDNALNQLVARSMLEAVGATVHIVENGALAVDFLRSGAPAIDLVLMDVQMPVMDGFAATQHIRGELGLDLPVLAMSAGVTLAERAECEAAGMNDFVAKPVDGDDLIATVLRHIHARQRN